MDRNLEYHIIACTSKLISATYTLLEALPIVMDVALMVDQHVLPADALSFPTQRRSGPASEKMLIVLCNSFTIENHSLK